MVLRLHYYHFQRHFVENCAPESYNSRTHAFKIIRCGRVNSFGRAPSIRMFKLKSRRYICHEQMLPRLPQLLIIIIRIHEHDQVHRIQGEFQCHHILSMPKAPTNSYFIETET